jgi:hypothetical protein
VDIKEWLGFISLAVTVIQYVPYCWATFQGKLKPHTFSYFIWGISAGVVFVAQYADKGGAGTWARALSTVACLLVGVLSARKGIGYITRSDWVYLVAALVSIPLWVITRNPLSAVILITLIDALAYFPTFRKAYGQPHEDAPSTYIIGGAKHFFSLLALENYNLTTTLTSSMIVVANTAVIILLMWRRAALGKAKS